MLQALIHAHGFIVHFPIAAFLISLVFFAVAYIKEWDSEGSKRFRAISFYLLVIAAVGAVFASGSGLLLEESFEGRAGVKLHEVMAIITTAFFVFCAVALRFFRNVFEENKHFYLFLMLGGAILVLVTGYLGSVIAFGPVL